MLGFGVPLSADALSSALATIFSVTDEGSTSSFSTRFPLIAQVVVNSERQTSAHRRLDE